MVSIGSFNFQEDMAYISPKKYTKRKISNSKLTYAFDELQSYSSNWQIKQPMNANIKFTEENSCCVY